MKLNKSQPHGFYLKQITEEKVQAFKRFKLEGWSNQVAARKALIGANYVSELLQRPDVWKLCYDLVDDVEKNRMILREKRKLKNEMA